MTVTIGHEREQTLKERADRLQVPIDEVVEQALSWYMALDPELIEDFAAIEEAHAEALWLIEDASS